VEAVSYSVLFVRLPIVHRRNSLFYKTENGARVGDMLMSLIYTAELNGANPFDYLIALQQHSDAVQASPEAWFPWNYQEAIATQSNTSTQPELHAVPP
jgi:transposase